MVAPIIMRGSSISQLNKPWESVLSLSTNIREYPKGSSIDLGRHDLRDKFYYIISGRIKLSYVGNNGDERTVLYGSSGSLMNVPTVLTGDVEDTLVECLTTTKIAFFDAKLLEDPAFIAEHPHLMANLLKSVSVQLVIQSRRLGNASIDSSLQQVAGYICELVDKHGGRLVFAPNISQQELAVLLGIHRTTVTRALVRLRRDNIIGKFTKREICVLDPEKLRNLVSAGD